jgi:hypothetical protein
LLWAALLVIGTILGFVAYTHDEWVVGKTSEFDRKVNLLSDHGTHSFWTAAFVGFTIALIALVVATCLAVFMVLDGIFKKDSERHRRFRDKAFKHAKWFAWTASAYDGSHVRMLSSSTCSTKVSASSSPWYCGRLDWTIPKYAVDSRWHHHG